ncbi:hypothetical protein [Streptomyces sp. NPDC086023]|uniref:hypothetical protein n=1 Tax=Streptomyces sp. NPDC086023 TaxID=3365746 RepID=UPI0037D02D93
MIYNVFAYDPTSPVRWDNIRVLAADLGHYLEWIHSRGFRDVTVTVSLHKFGALPTFAAEAH